MRKSGSAFREALYTGILRSDYTADGRDAQASQRWKAGSPAEVCTGGATLSTNVLYETPNTGKLVDQADAKLIFSAADA